MTVTPAPCDVRRHTKLVRETIRGVLKVAGTDLGAQLRAVIGRDDDYATAGKPVCDYDDRAARKQLVDALAKDGTAVLAVLDGRQLGPVLAQAGALLATVLGQDLDIGVDGVFTIARRVAPDRVISTVDPQARHGHKTSAHRLDGYKGHIAIDPDAEVITATAVTGGNTGDAACAVGLLAGDLPEASNTDDPSNTDDLGNDDDQGAASEDGEAPLAVYGDAAYGAGSLLADLEAASAQIMTKVQPPVTPGGRFTKDRFVIDTEAGTVTCPAGVVAAFRAVKAGGQIASFGTACAGCPLAAACTNARDGRRIRIGIHEAELVRARTAQADPGWRAEYRATRPKVERKIGHLMRRRHGGRRARVRGQTKVAADFSLLAAAVNLARFGVLGLTRASGRRWVVATS